MEKDTFVRRYMSAASDKMQCSLWKLKLCIVFTSAHHLYHLRQDESSLYLPRLFPQDSLYYLPIYAQVFYMVSFINVSPTKNAVCISLF